MKKGELVTVVFVLSVPCDTTKDELDAWVCFELGWRSQVTNDNPLLDHDLEAVVPPILSMTSEPIKRVLDGKR